MLLALTAIVLIIHVTLLLVGYHLWDLRWTCTKRIGILCNPENFQWWMVCREWRLSTPTCMLEQIAFRTVLAILSPDVSHTPNELRFCHQRKTRWVNILVCRSSIQACTFSCGQPLMLRRKLGSAVTALPRLWPLPSSPLHSDKEVVQLFS